MTKLSLTPARRQIIDASLKEWLETGTSCAPADFESAEAAVTRLYESIGKKRPHFVHLSSPFAAELYINLLTKTWPDSTKRGQLRGQLGDQLWGQLRGQLWDQLGGQLGGQLRGQLGDQLWDQLWDQLGVQLGGQLGGQLWAQLGVQLGGQLGDQLRVQLWGQLRGQKLSYMGTWFWGAWDYYWMWLDGGRRVGAVYPSTLNDALDDHITICRNIGWWYPFNDFCILTDRPAHMHFDEQNRLHSPDKPSISYRDGYSLWHIHGLPVPRQVIETPETLTFEQVRDEPNAEIRRHMLERFNGLYDPDNHTLALSSWIQAGNLKPISREDITHKMQSSAMAIWRGMYGNRPVTCDLYRAELVDDEPLAILTVVCTSSAKVVPLRVPPTITDAAKARAWTFGRDLAEALET